MVSKLLLCRFETEAVLCAAHRRSLWLEQLRLDFFLPRCCYECKSRNYLAVHVCQELRTWNISNWRSPDGTKRKSIACAMPKLVNNIWLMVKLSMFGMRSPYHPSRRAIWWSNCASKNATLDCMSNHLTYLPAPIVCLWRVWSDTFATQILKYIWAYELCKWLSKALIPNRAEDFVEVIGGLDSGSWSITCRTNQICL